METGYHESARTYTHGWFGRLYYGKKRVLYRAVTGSTEETERSTGRIFLYVGWILAG